MSASSPPPTPPRAAAPLETLTLDADIRVRRDGFVLDLRLTIAPGEVLAVLGPNGSGKTTLLHALAGLLPLEAGRLFLGDRLLEDAAIGHRLPPQRRRIGVVFQNHRLFPHMTVAENLRFGPRALRWPKPDARRAVEAALSALDLEGLAARPAGSLSVGQAQRVAIARALAIRPRLLLLDEPLAALDREASARVLELLDRVLRDPDLPPAGALLVTHRPEAARALARRWLVLEAGRETACDAPDALRAAPASAYLRSLFEG